MQNNSPRRIRTSAGPSRRICSTTSASGFDPDLSPASALAQAPRVAKVRGVSRDTVEGVVMNHIEGRQLGFLGEPRVNVLKLNMDLDHLHPMRR
jgi:potassium-transporting ATPase KdpC subunit